MGCRKVCRKGCRYCRYRYFGCCDFCNILGLTPDSELLPLIVITRFWCRCRGGGGWGNFFNIF